ncbi:MAG: ParA family protein [Dehalococcoidia bacterium]
MTHGRPIGTLAATSRIVAFSNQKGGVGKTTSAVNLSALLAARGYRALLIDIDPQGNATSSLGIEKTNLATTIYDVLIGGLPIEDAILPQVRPRLDLLPAMPTLAGAEVELVERPNRERVLARGAATIRDGYDIILIDCPPSLGLLTVNALTAANYVIIPIQCEFLALEGLSQLITTISLVKQHLNPELEVLGTLMTMYDARTRLSPQVAEEVRRIFAERHFATVIPRSVRLAEAPSYGQNIAEYDPASKGGHAYDAVTNEVVHRLAMRPPASRSEGESTSNAPAQIIKEAATHG